MFSSVKATIKDLPEILTIEQASFKNPWSKESLATQLSNPLSFTIIAKSSCKSITYGYSCCRVIFPEAELLRVAVSPELRQHGIAKALLSDIFKFLHLQQVIDLHLEVSEKNHEAIALYEKTGFLLKGRRPGYYDKGATAALLLERKL